MSFALEIVERTSAREPSLEQELRVADDPREVAAVYADWLQQRGDPRGTIIALALEGHEGALAAALVDHAAHLFGPIEDPAAYIELEWSLGMVVGVRWIRDNPARRVWPEGTIALLSTVLALPICTCVRKLWVDSNQITDPGFTAMLDALGPDRLAALRELVLLDGWQGPSLDWSLFSGLERLELTNFHLRGLELPRLRELGMYPEFVQSAIESLRSFSLPRLATLNIHLRWVFVHEHEAPELRSSLDELFALPIVTSLRTLRIVGEPRFEDQSLLRVLIAALAEAPGLERLAAIDLRQLRFDPEFAPLLRVAQQRRPNLVFE